MTTTGYSFELREGIPVRLIFSEGVVGTIKRGSTYDIDKTVYEWTPSGSYTCEILLSAGSLISIETGMLS